MSNNTANIQVPTFESDVTPFVNELIELLKDKIDGFCSVCGRYADEPKPPKCEYSEEHEAFYWNRHPVDYALRHYGVDSTIFNAERVNSHIAEHEDLSRVACALVFDGNGLFDYLSYHSPLSGLVEAINELADKHGFTGENYHHWNLVFYRKAE